MIILSLILGFCLFLTTIITDLENDLRSLNEDFTVMENSVWNDTNHIEIKHKFIDIIRFYSEAKMLVLELNSTDFQHNIKDI